MIVSEDWKLQFVDINSWIVIEQKFDEIIKKYNGNNEKIYIVENDWELFEIRIKE
jgi:hypothetical protein